MVRRKNPRRTCNSLYTVRAATDNAHDWSGDSSAVSDDIAMVDALAEGDPLPETTTPAKFVVGLDFGTTYTSVSYVKLGSNGNHSGIRSILDWPEAFSRFGDQRTPQVPSESWYLGDEYLWGYSVETRAEYLRKLKISSFGRIRHSKLLLINNDDGSGPGESLREMLKEIGKTEHEVIKDYLVKVFEHTKAQLTENENYMAECEVEPVLCVPAGWPVESVFKIQNILGEVLEEIGFGTIFDVFIVQEPEAAAACALDWMPTVTNMETKRGGTFIVCDAGGGTVDVTTYNIRDTNPLRLSEVTRAAGYDCGSTYVNQALRADISERLENETYLYEDGNETDLLIDRHIMPEFEFTIKRRYDYKKPSDRDDLFTIPGLKKNEEKGFDDELISIPRNRIYQYFAHSLNGTRELIERQVDDADKKNFKVTSILLAGGFSSSPTLRHYLEDNFRLKLYYPVMMDMYTAVSHGAVYRALNKSNGPSRHILANFGILQTEEFVNKFRGHAAAAEVYHNHNDGKVYAGSRIHWLIKKKLHKTPFPTTESFMVENYQVFEEKEKLEIRQRLYYSTDEVVKDHYHIDHDVNQNAKLAGRLVVDLTKLKDSISPKEGPTRKKYYEIHYALKIEVNGLNIKISLFHEGQSQGDTRICIAGAFYPGTR